MSTHEIRFAIVILIAGIVLMFPFTEGLKIAGDYVNGPLEFTPAEVARLGEHFPYEGEHIETVWLTPRTVYLYASGIEGRCMAVIDPIDGDEWIEHDMVDCS
jgi:hypothetical protein